MIKICFHIIPEQEEGKENFDFTVPNNNIQPLIIYQESYSTRKVNNSILYPYFVQQSLEIICKQFPQSKIYYYMDDIMTDSEADTLEKIIDEVKRIFPCCG